MKTRKIYRSIDSYILNVSIPDGNGVSRTFRFGGADRYMGVRGSYTAFTKEEQELLESSPMFGKEYILEKEFIIEEPKQKPIVHNDVADAAAFTPMTFQNIKKCQEHLEQNFGVKPYICNTQAKCIEIGKENGLLITFESNK